MRSFPPEELHLLDFGCVKKILKFLRGETNGPAKLSKSKLELFSRHLIYLKQFLPKEFNRKIRGLDELARWKGTELRTFRNYLGIVVLKNVVSDELYEHFLYFYVAVRIMSSEEYCESHENLKWCEELLRSFVKNSIALYGPPFVTYIIHSLIHLPQDVIEFGPLQKWSSYWSENELGKIKLLPKSKNKMLQQVVKRLDERIKNNLLCETEVSVDTKVKRPHTYGPIVDSLSSGTQYEKINFSNLDISIFTPDNVVTISEGSTDTKVLLIENIIEFENDFFLVGKLFLRYCDFFNHPLPSSAIGTRMVSNLSSALSYHPINSVVNKCVMLPVKFPAGDEWVVSPINLNVYY